MPPANTALSRLGIGTAEPVTQRLDFIDFDLGVEDELRDLNGTRGKYSKDAARVRKNLTRVQPRLRTQPTALELTYLLPWIMGGTPTGTPVVTYPLGNTAPTRFVAFDPNVGNLWTLSGVAVDNARFRGSQGEPLDVELDLVGQDYAVAGAFPAISLDISTQPFLFVDAVIQVAGGSVSARDLDLMVANGIDRNRFFNSRTLTALNKLTRRITVALTVPFGDHNALFGAGVNGASVTATFTNGAAVLTFSLADVRLVPRSPQAPFQQEVMLTLEGEAFMANPATESLVVTLNTGV